MMGRPPIGASAMDNAERQLRARANRAERIEQMRSALKRIRDKAKSVREARQIATEALDEGSANER